MVRPVSSETRRPLSIASPSIVRSRRPIQVDVLGAARRASISGSVRWVMMVRSWRFGWDREHACDQCGVFGMLEAGVSVEGADRGQAGVAGSDRVVAVVLEVVKERGDQLGVDGCEVELGGWGGETLLGVVEQ
jgi:hypothetical protein